MTQEVFIQLGIALLLARGLLADLSGILPPEDGYFLSIGSLVFGVMAVAVYSFGPDRARQLAFPLGFLCFFAPLPSGLLNAINQFLQHASADASYWLIQVSQVPVLKNGLFLQLPGITLEVAEESIQDRKSVV